VVAVLERLRVEEGIVPQRIQTELFINGRAFFGWIK
jgi:hypothetical protein